MEGNEKQGVMPPRARDVTDDSTAIAELFKNYRHPPQKGRGANYSRGVPTGLSHRMRTRWLV